MNLAPVVEAISRKRRSVPPERATLVAISGIDASGTGHATARLAAELEGRGLGLAAIHFS